jgi:hypothetical protein
MVDIRKMKESLVTGHAIVSVSFIFISLYQAKPPFSSFAKQFHMESERITVVRLYVRRTKAVAVRAICSPQPRHSANRNAIMVGDAEKLVDERSLKVVDDWMQLRSMFIHSWMQTLMDGYRKIRNYFVPVQGRNTDSNGHVLRGCLKSATVSSRSDFGNSLPDNPYQ